MQHPPSSVDVACRGLVLMAALAMATGCSDPASNFSQYPGFAEWFAANPPAGTLPTSGEESLLERYKPRFYLPPDHQGPIDFYRDYVAAGYLQDGDGKLISDQVTQALLNAHKAEPGAVFTHTPSGNAPHPVVYGRFVSENVDWPGCSDAVALAFLSYHLVFRSSGLPAGLPWWQDLPLSLVIDLDDWHQLDHYTAVTIVLAGIDEQRQHPLAAIFQQHNYQRTYRLSGDDGAGHLSLPADARIEIDIARRSNELYPHRPMPARRRAVSFMDPDSARYMVAEGKAPWLAADDITDPAIAIDPPLSFVRPDDAFYMFQGWLGARRRLPGRDGPPGADYNTRPAMKPPVNQMALSYWSEADRDWLALYDDLHENGRPGTIDPTPFLEKMAKDLDPVC